jgi:hypothetical protein
VECSLNIVGVCVFSDIKSKDGGGDSLLSCLSGRTKRWKRGCRSGKVFNTLAPCRRGCIGLRRFSLSFTHSSPAINIGAA